MRTHGKKYQGRREEARRSTRAYQPKQALELVKSAAFAKFDETVEVAVRLGVDPRHADQVVRGTVVLPAGTGKSVRVLVIAVGDKAREARSGRRRFRRHRVLAKIKDGWLDFDVLIATPDQMGQLGQLGRVLGPRGLMPNPKAGTVTFDVGRRCARRRPARSSSASTRAATSTPRSARSRSRSMRCETNFTAFMDQIVRSKPAAAKGVYVRNVAVSSTMGPGVTVDTTPYR